MQLDHATKPELAESANSLACRRATFQQLIDEGLLEIGDGYRAQNNELGGGGPIFLRAGHVTDSHIDFTGVERFHEHLANKVHSKTSKVGDTIITTKGNSTGRTSFVTDRMPAFVYSPHLSYWRSRNLEKVCPGFLRYWSQGNEFGRQLAGMKTSTDMAPYLSLTDQRRLRITIPPLPEQKAIAAVLGALDDKIELNRRMNVTLEAMARALFQSWFVDFDPVRQNIAAKPQSGQIPEAANLLAGKASGKWFTYAIECKGGSLYIGQTDNLRRRWKQHVDGKGAEWTKAHPPVALVFWELHDSLEAAVAREAKLKSGSGREWLKREVASRPSVRLPAGEAGAKAEGRPPCLSGRQAAALFPAQFQPSELGEIPQGWEVCPLSQKIRLLSGGTPKTSEPTYWNGDIPWYSVRDVPAESDVWVIHTDKTVTKLGIATSAAQVFPERTTIISARGTVGKLALTAVPMAMNQSCYGVRGITGYGDYFTFYLLRQATFQLQQRTHGTVFDTITTETFKTLDCVFPLPEISIAFDRLVDPLLSQIRKNLYQSFTLVTLRDTLLPKLLSGEKVTNQT